MSDTITATNMLEARAAEAVKKAPHLIGHRLRCEANEGQITLHGVVSSYFQKQMAQETIRRIDGVTEITNLLEVSWSRCQAPDDCEVAEMV